MRALSPLESVVGLSIAGSMLAIFVPAFVRNFNASRFAEPLDGLQQIGASANALAEQRPPTERYPKTVGLTPRDVPAGSAVTDPEGLWEHPTWLELGFKLNEPHYFSFSFESDNTGPTPRFVARAHGDLDGDRVYSTFEITGEYREGEGSVVFPIEMEREVE